MRDVLLQLMHYVRPRGGDNPFGYENSLMAHIRRIREKIEQNPSQPVSLVTIKGLGYKLNVEDR